MLGSAIGPTAESATPPIVVAVNSAAPTTAAAAPAPAPAEQSVDNSSDAVAAAPVEAPVQQTRTVYVQAPTAPATPPPPAPLPVPPLPTLPSVSHVWVVMLTGHGYDSAFGPSSQAPYLSKTLTTHGELIPNYYGIAHGGLANEIALMSGQGPTTQTAANCPDYGDITPGTVGEKDQVQGDGCVYPKDTKTLTDQLFLGGNLWKAYIEDWNNSTKDCKPNDAYESWRNPFLYFHSIVDSPGCATDMADMSQLTPDLQDVSETPAFSYLIPDKCHDGSDTDCTPDDPTDPTGLAAADAWLQNVIPQIEASPGYKQGGLIAITFDATPKDGPEADSTACCGQPDQYPNLPADDPSQQPDPNATPTTDPGTTTDPNTPAATSTDPAATTTQPTTTDTGTTTTPSPTTPPTRPSGGGGKVGLLLISPYVKPNTVNETGYYNHFSLFASIEDLFTIGHIAYANLPDLTTFDSTVYTNYNSGPATD